MDPHSSSATTIYETEEAERTRGWVPALLTALLTTGGLWALQHFSGRAPLSTWADGNAAGEGGLPATLLGAHLTYFGSGALTDHLVRSGVVTAALFVVAYLVSWLGTIGIWPRAWWPVVLGSWFAATLAGALGLVAGQVEDHLAGGQHAIARLDDVVATGGAYGLLYGPVIGLLVSLVWVAVPGRRAEPTADAGPAAPAEEPSLFGAPGSRSLPASAGPAAATTQVHRPMPAMPPRAQPVGPPTQAVPTQAVPTRAAPTQAVPTQRSHPSTQATPATPGTAPEAQPVRVRTFTAPTRGQGAAYDTAAWKAFVRDVRGDKSS